MDHYDPVTPGSSREQLTNLLTPVQVQDLNLILGEIEQWEKKVTDYEMKFEKDDISDKVRQAAIRAMAPEAVMAARDAIKTKFGEKYLPKSPRMYKNKAKNAQEAHECIRPTDMMLSPDRLKVSADDQRKLYDLIWKRTIASHVRPTEDYPGPTENTKL